MTFCEKQRARGGKKGKKKTNQGELGESGQGEMGAGADLVKVLLVCEPAGAHTQKL